MVLVHKLKQMEALDIEQFRDDGSLSDSPQETEPPTAAKSSVSPQLEKKRTTSPRRPTTRSQTGYVATKRRGGDYGVFEKETPASTSKSPSIEVAVEEKVGEVKLTSVEREISTERSASPNASAAVAGQYTFLGTSPIPDYDRRGLRSRATLPVPVPNLTKKSRGRRVPTKPVTLADNKDGVHKAARLYACPVANCMKCFNRGEHLKRHIRSIHTNEKPFACSYPSCDKFFNRHDNLLQHLKVHKDFSPPPTDDNPHNLPSETETYSSPVSTNHAMLPPTPSYTIFTSYHTPSTGLTTNMAVSSLRTELPHSPTADTSTRGTHESPVRPRYRPTYENSPGHSPPLLLRSIAPQHDWQA